MARIDLDALHPEDLPEQTTDDCVCQVIIKCRRPSEDGEMQVEMEYEGDKVLASYLLHSAQQMMDN